MKILFKTAGGFGFFPGLNRPLELNSNELPAEEANHLQQLITETDFFNLPDPAQQVTLGADMKQYLIKVEEHNREKWIQVNDNNMPPRLQELVTYLSDKQRKQRPD